MHSNYFWYKNRCVRDFFLLVFDFVYQVYDIKDEYIQLSTYNIKHEHHHQLWLYSQLSSGLEKKYLNVHFAKSKQASNEYIFHLHFTVYLSV